MYNEEQKIESMAKSLAFILFMLLLSSYFEPETIIIVLLCLIYSKMRK